MWSLILQASPPVDQAMTLWRLNADRLYLDFAKQIQVLVDTAQPHFDHSNAGYVWHSKVTIQNFEADIPAGRTDSIFIKSPASAMAEKQPFFWVLVSISTAQGSQKRHLIMATTVPNPV